MEFVFSGMSMVCVCVTVRATLGEREFVIND